MNILEEIPKSKSANSNSSFFSLSSGPVSSGPATPAPAAPNPRYGAPVDRSNDRALSDHMSLFDIRSLIILILLILIAFTYFGINVLNMFGDAIQKGVDVVTPFVSQVLDLVGYSTGKAINTAADITADVSKEGVDLAEGAIQNVGNLLIGDEAIGYRRGGAIHDPMPDVPEDNIQKSLSSAKTKWCLVGEYQNKRGCIDISESDKCLSGQVFPNEEMCLNPNMMMTKQR